MTDRDMALAIDAEWNRFLERVDDAARRLGTDDHEVGRLLDQRCGAAYDAWLEWIEERDA